MATAPNGRSPSRLNQLRDLRLFELVFKSFGLPVVATDLHGLVTDANSAAEALLGYEPGEMHGRSSADLLARGQEPFEARESRRGTWSAERRLLRSDGSTVLAQCTVTLLRNEAGEPHGHVLLLVDDSAARRERTRLASLRKLSEALNSEGDPRDSLELICREARSLFGADGVYLMSFDEQADELVGVVAAGRLEDEFQQHRYRLADKGLRIVQAARQKAATIDNAVQPRGQFEQMIERLGVKAVLAVPLVRGERLLGALSLTSCQPNVSFTSSDAEMARAFGELAASALESVRLHEASRDRRAELLALTEVNAMLVASLEREQVFETITAGARKLLRADEVRIWLLETPTGPLRLAYVAPTGEQRLLPPLVELSRSRMGIVVRTGQPWQIADIHTERPASLWQYTRATGLRGCLMVPLLAQGQPLGCLSFLSREVRVFDENEVELALTLGHQAAVAVHNAARLEEDRQVVRLDLLLRRAELLEPRDRAMVDQLVSAAERIVELAAPD